MSDLVREASPLYARRVSFWKRLSDLLGLKEPVYGPIDLAESLGEGLALTALDALVREGYLKPAEVALVAPPRTLTHRRQKRERLRPDESERLARIGKTLVLAEQVFGDKHRALEWLRAPKRRLRGKSAFELLSTAEGGQVVEEELIAVDEGYVA
ncbi:MAG: antitoxin Xre/MbcA/ParS toxin-binding domain-containing protein, partial [Gammaproteobacteria bacterium]